MQCFVCADESATQTVAVSICVSCGAGLCHQHALTGHQEEAVPSFGNPVVRRLPGRRLFCGVCAPAYVPEGNHAADLAFASN